MLHKVLLDTHFRRRSNIFYPNDLKQLYSLSEVLWGKDEPITDDELFALKEYITVVITGQWRYGDVSQFPKLKAIFEVSGGFPSPRQLSYKECFARGIRVMSCAPAFGPVVAEMALGLSIAVARQIAWNDAAFRKGQANWSHKEFGGTFSLYDKLTGFIGFGGLARSLRNLLKPFRNSIQVYDPWLTDSYLKQEGVRPASLEHLLKTSRFIYVLALPTQSNRALLDRQKLELITDDSVFLLMSRAHIVDFEALTDLLSQGRFKAGIDVFPQEPLHLNHPIRQLSNVVLSSHRAGAIGEGLLNIGRLLVRDVEAVVSGRVPQEFQVAQPEYIRERG